MGSHGPGCAPPVLRGKQWESVCVGAGALLAAELWEARLMAQAVANRHNLIRGLW